MVHLRITTPRSRSSAVIAMKPKGKCGFLVVTTLRSAQKKVRIRFNQDEQENSGNLVSE